MDKYLIVNADDFGLSEGVSLGVLEAHKEGILTSTTFMVNFPWADEMATLLREAPELGVGIHLNITTGSPVLDPGKVPSLVGEDGQFAKSLWHLRFGIDPSDVFREWSAQVEMGMQLLGRHPTHLDTHRYLQAFPGMSEVLVEVARTYNIPAVRCVHPGPDLDPKGFPTWGPAGLLVDRYLRRSVATLIDSGLQYPQATIAGDFDTDGLLHKLARVRVGVTELICHPGRVDDRLRSLSSLQEQREAELAALMAPQVKARVAELGLKLVSFAALAS